MSTHPITPDEVVRSIYAALCTVDPEAIRAAAAQYFADDIVVHEPESLPWGGVHSGRERVTELMALIGDPASPIDAARLTVDQVIHTGDEVVAAVSFPWRGPAVDPYPMRALEWFTLRDGKVNRIQVYLWDTAAGLAVLNPTGAHA